MKLFVPQICSKDKKLKFTICHFLAYRKTSDDISDSDSLP
jgi:hypothetical protein